MFTLMCYVHVPPELKVLCEGGVTRSLLLLFPQAARSYFPLFSAGSWAGEGHLGELTLFQADQPPCCVPQGTAWHACDFPHRFLP